MLKCSTHTQFSEPDDNVGWAGTRHHWPTERPQPRRGTSAQVQVCPVGQQRRPRLKSLVTISLIFELAV